MIHTCIMSLTSSFVVFLERSSLLAPCLLHSMLDSPRESAATERAPAFTATRRFFLRQPPRLREGSCVLPAVKGIVRKLFLVNSSLLEGGGILGT